MSKNSTMERLIKTIQRENSIKKNGGELSIRRVGERENCYTEIPINYCPFCGRKLR